MKFEMESVEIESSGVISEDSFGIANMGFVLHLLRSKIYSNIKRAICQEYTCNARDAHREAGKADVPIEVTLPTYLDPNFRVRDFGNSISPENMTKVFIQYGASTKRDSNLQTGGFGIGCKTAFGYSDAFSVVTIRKGVKRNYSCVIDDTRCGKLALLSETSTDELDGTEIIVPVIQGDFEEFARETVRACRHWDVKPIIRGRELFFDDVKKNVILEGTDWFVCRANDSHGNRETRLIVDGIEYPFDLGQLPDRIIPTFGWATTLYLKFPVGVISVSANREAVEIDAATKKAVTARLHTVKNEIKTRFEETVKNAKSFIEANITLHRATSSLNLEMPDDLTWKGHKLFGQAIRLDRGQVTIYDRGTTAKKHSRYPGSTIPLAENKIYCMVNLDFNNVVSKGAEAIFKKFPNADQVIMFRVDAKEFQDKNLSLLNVLNFDDYYTAKQRRASLGRLLFYKFDKVLGIFSRSSMKEYEADSNKKIWCRLNKVAKGSPIVLYNGKEGRNDIFNSFVSHALNDHSIYGFSTEIPADKVEEATEEMTKLEDFCEEHLKEQAINLGKVRFVSENEYKRAFLFDKEEEEKLQARINEIKNKNSALVTYLSKSTVFAAEVSKLKKYMFFLYFDKAVKEDIDMSFTKAAKEAVQSYPLFKYMTYNFKNSDYYSNRELQAEIDEVIEYVNTVDTAKGLV